MKIDLPLLKQSTPHTCLPACIRIILKYYGHELSEETIASACQVNHRGARFEHVSKFIQSLGLESVRLKEAGLQDLFDRLTVHQPVIVAVGAEHLPYAQDRTTHAIITNGLELESDKVIVIDPALGKEVRLDSLVFFRAWTSRGRSGLVIEKRG